jgi:hypothetical protein
LVKGGLGGLAVGGQKRREEGEGGLILSAGGSEETGEDGEGQSAIIGSRPERDFASEHGTAESAFGMVVGRWHTGSVEEGKKFLGIPVRREETVV